MILSAGTNITCAAQGLFSWGHSIEDRYEYAKAAIAKVLTHKKTMRMLSATCFHYTQPIIPDFIQSRRYLAEDINYY